MQGIGGRENISGWFVAILFIAAGSEIYRVALGNEVRLALLYLVDDGLEVVADDEQILLGQLPDDGEDIAQVPLADALFV